MGLIVKLLKADGIGSAGTTELYKVPATALGAIVNNVRVVNTGGSTLNNVNLYFTPSGGTDVRILEKDKSIVSNDIVVVKPELTMAPGDAIKLVTTGSPSLDYVVSGVEKV